MYEDENNVFELLPHDDFLEKKQILCVMCDRNYEGSDYINSYSKFTKIINKIN